MARKPKHPIFVPPCPEQVDAHIDKFLADREAEDQRRRCARVDLDDDEAEIVIVDHEDWDPRDHDAEVNHTPIIEPLQPEISHQDRMIKQVYEKIGAKWPGPMPKQEYKETSIHGDPDGRFIVPTPKEPIRNPRPDLPIDPAERLAARQRERDRDQACAQIHGFHRARRN